MHKLTVFNLGNADCIRIELDNGKNILFDYANKKNPDDKFDLRCDLPKELRESLDDAGRDYFDVVAFTHLDEDHYKGASEFFWLQYAKKYQDDDRIKISTLWVPAAIITEDSLDLEEASIIQKEARHRFKNGKDIRVFSRPERLKDWCQKNGIKLEDRQNIITDAGKIAPEFSREDDEVEFFVHSPFAKRLNNQEVEDRNADSLVMQATFEVEKIETKLLLMSDVPHEALKDIVEITRDKQKRPERLEWDIVKLPHHCSYTALGPEKGVDKTDPVDDVKWLFEDQGQDKGKIISPSKIIPYKGSDDDKDNNPPHRQAANYYKDILEDPDDQFLVTMEHPKKTAPKPIIIEIDSCKATVKKQALTASAMATGIQTPRAGRS